MKFDYDVIIIGSGPAGFSCAMQSTKFDKKVLVVEANSEYLGGTWINRGTVPSKAFREAAKLIQSFHSQFDDEEERKPYDHFKMEDLLRYKNNILENKNRKIKSDFIKNEVETARGWGRIIDGNTVEVTDQLQNKTTYSTEKIFIATGSRPTDAASFDIDHSNILDYDSILNLTHIPRRLSIIGSGSITFEYATIFAALGTRVTILSEAEDILTHLDHEVKEHLQKLMRRRKIQAFKNTKIQDIEANSLRTCLEVRFRTPEEDRLQVIETEYVLYVGGKKPNIENIGVKENGIKTNQEGFIEVNESYQTSLESVYAGGDVIGYPALASASFIQGRLAACNMFDIPAEHISENIPLAVYSIPEISSVGITENEARQQGTDVTVGRAYFSNLTEANLHQESEGLLKLVFKTDDLKLLGVHIIGDQASDLIHLGQFVMDSGGDIKYFIERVINYPSYTEAYRVAAFNGVNRVHQAGVKYKKILEKS
ncbi:MAG: Si-specific NAD(P)(+) transhydrogenase [Balneolaceae bacterium]